MISFPRPTIALAALAGFLSTSACTIEAVPPTAAAPRAIGSTPRDGELRVPRNATVSFFFDRPIDPATIGPRAIDVTSGQIRQGGVAGYDPIEQRLWFAVRGTLRSDLAYDAVLETDRIRGLRSGLPVEPRPLTFVTSYEEAPPREEPAMSFRDDVLPILGGSCSLSGCHGSPSFVAGLDLSGAEGITATAVGARTTLGWPGWPLIDSRSAAWSYLVYKILGEESVVGGAMPPGGRLHPASVRTLATWIDEGAKVDEVDERP